MLKDWEKSKYGVSGWQKKCDKNYLVSVEETSRYRDRAYVVKVINNGKRVRTSKKFRTINQAEMYARTYMRSH